MDAVHFVQAFKLTESFPPVPLLKTYLKDLRRNSQGKSGPGGAAAAQVLINWKNQTTNICFSFLQVFTNIFFYL